ncbi:unnamed protein product [Adineta steineri]|uniref:NAD(P)(+)--arginine ADP-ribosyltransferase n=1 Tax=Adineta steineri TaxID=433720 RepID=A0A819G412_9BILA|nr:unnamed protein product [Adineta steineri]CAF3876942.1 unnamed protein product [Adineta steineri]
MSFSFEVNPRLLVNIHQESREILEPICGYEQEPLVSLEEACQSLEYILGTELKSYITAAKLNSKEPKHGLTQDESASIYLYTMEWNKRENSLYVFLNQALCATDRSQLQLWSKYLKLFFTAIFKLPSTDYHTVWRGIAGDYSELYREGDELTWWSLSSATSSFSVLQSPMYLGREKAQTIFAIETKNGKLIREHSHLKNDDEILLLPGILLKVTGSCKPTDGIQIIYLREIEPPSTRLTKPFHIQQMNISVQLDQYRNPKLEEIIQSSEVRGKLSLDSMHLNDQDMTIVVKLGIYEKKCMILSLSHNEITSVGASILAQSFSGSKFLKSLILDNNRIMDEGVKSIAKAFANENIGFRALHLNLTGVTDAGCDYLAEMIRINPWIIHLYLDNNEITDRGVRVLCETIGSRNYYFIRLTVSGNKLLTDASVDALCHAML